MIEMPVHFLNYQLKCMSHTQHPSIWKTNRNVSSQLCVSATFSLFWGMKWK